MKFRFALLVGLLLATSVLGSTDSTTTEVTTPGATEASTSAGGGSTATAGSSASPASTGSPGTTVSSGPSQSPGTTVSGGTDQPSSANPVTSGGSTVSQGPTTSAPLPNVTVSYIQFGAPVCVDLTCTYEFNAPGNNQALLATDQSIINADRTQFSGFQASASAKDNNVKKANDDAMAKIKELQTLMDQIQNNLNWIQNATKTIKSQQDDATQALMAVEKYISAIQADSSNCLYQRCLKPTTPAPPTTTPTPAPTTTPDPCLAFNCPSVDSGAACVLMTGNKPYCTNCPNNMDGYTNCQTVACNATGTPFHSGAGIWYSVGYNSTGNSAIPSGSKCVYTLTGTYQSVADGLVLSCLTSQKVTIEFSSADGSFTQAIANTTTKRSLDSVLKKIPDGRITLTSVSGDPTSCQIPLAPLASSNGFFSWLMGN